MSPIIGEQDEFEALYTEKFRNLARVYGEFIKYERDRAAIDIGLHLKQTTGGKYNSLSSIRIWIQLKGKHTSTISAEEFARVKDVPLDLEIDHLTFWYASPEAVYLIVYIECADIFLAEEIRDIVDRQWGERIFHKETFRPDQENARIRISKDAILDTNAWARMIHHRALRIAGPTFRGRPLGHRLDPLRCIPNKLEPSVFTHLIQRLLTVHDFRIAETLDASRLFPNSKLPGDIASLDLGKIYYTYEWVPQLFNEFGHAIDDDFRLEGEIMHVQGQCAVLIHSNVVSRPDPKALKDFAQELVKAKNTSRLLVFANTNEDAYFGSFFGGVRHTELDCMPQLLGDLAFNLLTATIVYLEFRDKISWNVVNYLY